MTQMAGVAMAKEAQPRRKQGREWSERKAQFQSISVFREVARMAAMVARDEGISVAELTEPLLKGPLEAKYRKILERELKNVTG